MKINLTNDSKHKVKVIKKKENREKKPFLFSKINSDINKKTKEKILKKPKKILSQNPFQKFLEDIKKEYKSAELTVYSFPQEGSLEITEKISQNPLFGKPINYKTLEKYLSYWCVILLINPGGLEYKNRFITRILRENELYLIIISSHMLEVFAHERDGEVLQLLTADFEKSLANE